MDSKKSLNFLTVPADENEVFAQSQMRKRGTDDEKITYCLSIPRFYIFCGSKCWDCFCIVQSFLCLIILYTGACLWADRSRFRALPGDRAKANGYSSTRANSDPRRFYPERSAKCL